MKHLSKTEEITVIQRPPGFHVTLHPSTIAALDRFIARRGRSRGVNSRSAAVQFFLDQALHVEPEKSESDIGVTEK